MKKAANHINLIILLAVLSSVAPMGIDTYIPSIPNIAEAFHVGINKIELSLSIFLIGFSSGQVFGGSISDRYGRRNSSIIGLLGFAFFSVLIIFSSNVYELWFYRFFEAFFGGIVVVNAAAVVRDKFHGEESAKIFSLIGIIRILATLLAPVVGAIVVHFFVWQAVFVFLTIYAIGVALWTYFDLEESFTKTKQNVLESYKTVLTHKKAMKVMLVLSLGFSGFFIYISKSSFIFIEHFKIPTDYFPLFFSFNFIVLIILTKANVSLLKKFSTLELIKFATLVQLVCSLLMLLNYKGESLILTMLIMASYMGMMALIAGNCMSLALEHFAKNAGVASGVIGVLQFGVGALISSAVLAIHAQTFLPIALSTIVISLTSYFLIRSYK